MNAAGVVPTQPAIACRRRLLPMTKKKEGIVMPKALYASN